jgi:chromosome segregation ATPase
MDILDSIEEYSKLKELVVKHYNSHTDTKAHLENKLGQALETIEHSKQHVHSKLGQTETQLESRLNEHHKVVESFKQQIGEDHEKMIQTIESLGNTQKQLEQTVNALGQTRQQIDQVLFHMKNDIESEQKNLEEYKKITNERIEKLVKLFLSINK